MIGKKDQNSEVNLWIYCADVPLWIFWFESNNITNHISNTPKGDIQLCFKSVSWSVQVICMAFGIVLTDLSLHTVSSYYKELNLPLVLVELYKKAGAGIVLLQKCLLLGRFKLCLSLTVNLLWTPSILLRWDSNF